MCTHCHLTKTDQVPLLEVKSDRFLRVIVGVFIIIIIMYFYEGKISISIYDTVISFFFEVLPLLCIVYIPFLIKLLWTSICPQ